jgi:Flp pilus assembly pilin Flp
MVEYAIVAALIAIVSMAAVEALGGGIAQVFNNILSSISGIGS